jgi:KEOPS complex subunit Cgi121
MNIDQGDAGKVMESVIAKATAEDAVVLVLDGRMVFGSDHLASALFHAQRAIVEGRNASDSLQMEMLLYASGERQLSSAIGKMSVGDSTTTIVVALLSGEGFDPGERWAALPRRPENIDSESLQRFGVGPNEAGTVDSSRMVDLVLERVAAVDLIKR